MTLRINYRKSNTGLLPIASLSLDTKSISQCLSYPLSKTGCEYSMSQVLKHTWPTHKPFINSKHCTDIVG